jgi:hypothetical protein
MVRNSTITLEKLRSLKKKYKVTTTGNKLEIANGLWRVRGGSMSDNDVKQIIPVLSKDYKKKAEKLIMDRDNNPITDYKGMWVKQEKPLNKMTREELVNSLRKFRNAWERVTTRNQDLSNKRLKDETMVGLKSLLKHYYSAGAKQQAHNWLIK